MNYTTTDSLADLYFSLEWEKGGIRHREEFFADEANFYRDFFPLGIGNLILNKALGERVTLSFKPGELVAGYSDREIHKVRYNQVETHRLSQHSAIPKKGRVYPRGILNGLAGIYSENVTPFRVIDLNDNFVFADLNHPLSEQKLDLSVDIIDIKDKRKERGGLSMDWIDQVISGPGIQARPNGKPVDFFSDHPFVRDDEQTDTAFYKDPRMVNHIDETARENLSMLYGKYIKPKSRVLDLMSSWQSHLPDNLELNCLVGLGMNEQELAANPKLTGYHIHDLNRKPSLPFGDESFDAVICSLSVEYLTHPFDVFQDIPRILSPDGQCIITFSNRWFPSKTIRIWPHLHEFERLGLVTEYLLNTGCFENLKTHSVRGYPRPYTDPYFPKIKQSDPLFLISGTKS